MPPKGLSRDVLAHLRRLAIAKPSTTFVRDRWRYGPSLSRTIATHTHPTQSSAISILSTSIDKSSVEYKENAQQMGELLARMEELHQKISLGGTQKARDKHIARGKMLPRE